MELGKFEIRIDNKKIIDILHRITDEKVIRIYQVCERFGQLEKDFRRYDVYLIETKLGRKVLKCVNEKEVKNYEKYLSKYKISVPKYYGKTVDGNKTWILIEYIYGDDLRNMTDELAIAAAKSLSEIQNTCWIRKDKELRDGKRFDEYLKRINKRFQYIKDENLIGDAYSIFLNRQIECPKTLANGDFLQFNVVCKQGEVFVIDWGFGGIMPYSLDIARFIAHATENKETFPFYMNDKQKNIFIKDIYSQLKNKPLYSQYIYDIKLAVLNEYVEFIEADEDENGWYYKSALKLADDIIKNQI